MKLYKIIDPDAHENRENSLYERATVLYNSLDEKEFDRARISGLVMDMYWGIVGEEGCQVIEVSSVSRWRVIWNALLGRPLDS